MRESEEVGLNCIFPNWGAGVAFGVELFWTSHELQDV